MLILIQFSEHLLNVYCQLTTKISLGSYSLIMLTLIMPTQREQHTSVICKCKHPAHHQHCKHHPLCCHCALCLCRWGWGWVSCFNTTFSLISWFTGYISLISYLYLIWLTQPSWLMVEKCTYCTNPQALPSLNLPDHDFRSLGYILTERLHYYLHPHCTYIKQRGQGRGDTFSLGLNPPPSSVNCKSWGLSLHDAHVCGAQVISWNSHSYCHKYSCYFLGHVCR